jgi:hypothetical protein
LNTIIVLEDGIEVEVELDENQVLEISSNQSVASSISKIEEILKKIIRPFSNTYKELNKDVALNSAKITIGIKLSVEGNFILAKSAASAHLQVEINLGSEHV